MRRIGPFNKSRLVIKLERSGCSSLLRPDHPMWPIICKMIGLGSEGELLKKRQAMSEAGATDTAVDTRPLRIDTLIGYNIVVEAAAAREAQPAAPTGTDGVMLGDQAKVEEKVACTALAQAAAGKEVLSVADACELAERTKAEILVDTSLPSDGHEYEVTAVAGTEDLFGGLPRPPEPPVELVVVESAPHPSSVVVAAKHPNEAQVIFDLAIGRLEKFQDEAAVGFYMCSMSRKAKQ